MADQTLFDDLVQFPQLADMTEFLLMGMFQNQHGEIGGGIRMISMHPEAVRMFGELLGRMALDRFGFENGAQFLTELTAAAAMALHGHSTYATGESQ